MINRNIFMGRYGVDQLSVFLLIVAVLFWPIRYFWIIGVLLAAIAVYRSLSRNIAKRQRELWAFNGIMMRTAAFFRKYFSFVPRFFRFAGKKISQFNLRWQQRKTHVFLHCPKCRGTLRLPRGKGMLAVKCPLCGYEFKKKT